MGGPGQVEGLHLCEACTQLAKRYWPLRVVSPKCWRGIEAHQIDARAGDGRTQDVQVVAVKERVGGNGLWVYWGIARTSYYVCGPEASRTGTRRASLVLVYSVATCGARV